DAAESRGPNSVLTQVQAYAAPSNQVDVMVIQVGTNGAVTQAQYDAIAAAAAPVGKVFFMTIKTPYDYTEPNNAIIRALPNTYPNVQIIDWQTEAAKVEDGLSKADGGIHLNSGTAVRFYANLILTAAGLEPIPDPDSGGG
ncbi:MAG TPA: hypothetical protein PLV68_12755, partial [Ilumatobacteraceae bacterium]|nr:hypothetical protein [Ilumatobacteraceae bacterium]